MRTLILCYLFLLMQGIGYCQKQQNDFRGFTWGDSFDKVLSEEKAKYDTKKDRIELQYTDVLGGKDVKILYIFNGQSKLIEAVYFFTRKYNNPERYVLTYNAFSDLITEKYGTPTKHKERWISNDTANDKANPGQAVLDGDLSLYNVWMTDRVIIKSTLSNVVGKPSMQIHYTTRSLDVMENEEELRSALKML